MLTFCWKWRKVLDPTPVWSPVADQIKLKELHFGRLVERGVEQRSSFAPCIHQFCFKKVLPGARLGQRSRNAKLFSGPVSIKATSFVFYLETGNWSRTGINFDDESLALGLTTFCQPIVSGPVFPTNTFILRANKNAACWKLGRMGSAPNHLRVQRTMTI